MQHIVNQDNICSILLAGENSKVEFKTTVKNTYKHLSKIISAFANTDGGVVIFGYDEIHQSVIGTSTDDFEMVKEIIFTNKLDNVCKFYTLLYEEKTIIIVQIEKSKSLVIAKEGAYIRRGECNTVLTSDEMRMRVISSYETSDSNISKEAFERLEKKTVEIYDILIRSQKEHEEELKEQKKEHEIEKNETKRNNWFFCILSALIGFVLGKFF